jgi:PAS domain S-box-containing protein
MTAPNLPSPGKGPLDAPRRAPLEVPFAVLAETAPDAIVTIDAASRILSVNPATERIFGWSAAEMLGRPLSMLMPPELRPAHEAGMARYLGTGVRHIPWNGVPLEALTREGRRLPVEISFGEFLLDGQRIFSGFIRDVSDRAAQRAELERTSRDLESAIATLHDRVEEAEAARGAADAANEAKSQFLATMSRELRTPLNAIGGYVELLTSGIRGPVTPSQREDLVRIGRAQARLLALINDVLNFARLETGRVEYDIRRVAVNTLLCSLGPLLDPQIRAKALVYECDPGAADVRVCADQQKLEQILLNLLSNAVKFTPEGGRISVATDADADEVRLYVRDSGLGIPPDRLGAVFEPFVQVDATLTRVHGGTGLGLAISQELARGMGGEISVESRVGEGSEFTLRLPVDGGCGAPPQSVGFGDLLMRDVQRIVRNVAARLRQEPTLPTVTDAELEDHTATLLTDLAQLLLILDASAGVETALLQDGVRIQGVIVELHGRQRRRLGFSEALLAREFELLADETAVALRSHATGGDVGAVEDCVALIRALVGEAAAGAQRELGA